MKDQRLRFSAFVCLCALFLMASTTARPVYRLQAIAQLHILGSPLKKSTMACTYCHQTDQGGASWNPFGVRIRTALHERPDQSFGQALSGVLSSMKDSDQDGYEDVLEVFANTQPGNAKSTPTEPRPSLLQRFQASGGMDLYQPKQ